jgi:hypothetical protein
MAYVALTCGKAFIAADAESAHYCDDVLGTSDPRRILPLASDFYSGNCQQVATAVLTAVAPRALPMRFHSALHPGEADCVYSQESDYGYIAEYAEVAVYAVRAHRRVVQVWPADPEEEVPRKDRPVQEMWDECRILCQWLEDWYQAVPESEAASQDAVAWSQQQDAQPASQTSSQLEESLDDEPYCSEGDTILSW